MNFIGVIACLGLLFGTLFESGAVPVDASTNPETEDVLPPESCFNCTESNNKGVSSATEQFQLSTSSISSKLSESSSTSDTSTAEKGTKVAPNTLIKVTTSEILSQKTVTDPSVSNGTDDSSTLKPTDVTSTTQALSTTEKSTVEPTTTGKPSTTDKTTTTSVSPTPTPSTSSTVPPTSPAATSTKAALTTEAPTEKPAEERRFDGPSFIGGIVFALGVTAIAFVAWKFYKARTERNYHTL